MAFKLRRNIFRKKLEDNTLAEANMDGSISVDPSVNLDSPLGKRVIKHEKEHIKQIKSGRGTYTDNYVTWLGKKYKRKDGKIKYKGKWKHDGWNGFPWEKEAIRAETK